MRFTISNFSLNKKLKETNNPKAVLAFLKSYVATKEGKEVLITVEDHRYGTSTKFFTEEGNLLEMEGPHIDTLIDYGPLLRQTPICLRPDLYKKVNAQQVERSRHSLRTFKEAAEALGIPLEISPEFSDTPITTEEVLENLKYLGEPP